MDTFSNNTWRPKLLPRKTLNAKHVEQVKDEFNRVTTQETPFSVENASAHPISGDKAKALPEGYRDKKAFQVYTTTPVEPAREGTDILHDLIETRTGVWCKVVKVEEWTSGLQEHYLAYVTEENER